jgi:hypothetical protein
MRWVTHEGIGKAVLKVNVRNSAVVKYMRIVYMGNFINNAQDCIIAEWMMQSQ